MSLLSNYSFKKRHVFYLIVLIIAFYIASKNISFTDHQMLPDQTSQTNVQNPYSVPLDPDSPWPKFRANSLQNGRTTINPAVTDLNPWHFQTGKGIFSSPVIDGQGNVYIGSADQYFYAIDKTGKVIWKYLTGEIIDSSALLDNQEKVYVGSGDAYVYAFDRKTGENVWRFKAHTPQEVTEKFDVKTYNLNWFEGNIAMLPDGSIIAPNDNYLIYRLNRNSGETEGQFVINEMGWSLSAVNAKTNRLFTGSNFMALKNAYSFDIETGEEIWTNGGYGTNAASALLTSDHPNGAVIIGGYDGFVRAFSQKDGFQIWKYGTRDHIYASPAQQADGTIIQPSTDGTVYALNPEDGEVIWAFDTKEPIRSSPAIDGDGNIYFGAGDGRLYCLNPNGTLRWAYQLIDDDRNDLNGSPALGKFGVLIAGESGGIFFTPYDYPVTQKGKNDPKSIVKEGEDLPDNGAFLVYTTGFGALTNAPPKEIEANQPLSFSLLVRENGDTVKTAIDRSSVRVSFTGGGKGKVDTSANNQFITLVPQETWTDSSGGEMSITIQGQYDKDLSRFGLKFYGGDHGGDFNETFRFTIKPRKASDSPFMIPTKSGDPSSTIEISRLAPASPSILPSYNQIGYDSLHYILGAVEGNAKQVILWGIGGKLIGKEGKTIVDPNLEVRFPMVMNYDDGLVTIYNYDGILLDMNGSWDMPIDFFRFAGTVDPQSGDATSRLSMNAIVACDEIEFYGKFLKLLGMSEFDTGHMFIYGGANLSLFGEGATKGPDFSGNIEFIVDQNKAIARITSGILKKSDHVHSLLLVNPETGNPISAKYIDHTRVVTDDNDIVTELQLLIDDLGFKGNARIYYMVDTYPVAKDEITLN